MQGGEETRLRRHSSVGKRDENKERGNWSGQLDFLMSCLSYAVGLGNLWRFPYLCYRNGGGAFLIPYVIMLVFTGIPLFFMELSFGQFAAEGVISIWKVSPLFQGIGWGMFIVSFFISVYYNMIIAWTLYYLYNSFFGFSSDLSWTTCDNEWNSLECGLEKFQKIRNCTVNSTGVWYNETCVKNTTENHQLIEQITGWSNSTSNIKSISYASDEFFHRNMLDISEGFHEMGAPKYEMIICLFAAWTLVGCSLIKSIKSSGKVVYFTASFPYIVLICLLVRGLTLPGCLDGILFYLTPQWHRLLSAKVWGDAAVQIFFSLSPCWGGLITLASYNRFRNNCLRDALFVSISNCLTSFFAGFVIFGIIGYMAHIFNLPVDAVAKEGVGLAFIVYPEAVSRFPVAAIWAVVFFLMLLALGLGTQIATVTTVHTTLMDVFPKVFRVGRRPMILTCIVCIVGFIFGISCTTRGGIFMLQLIDNYAATYSVLIIGLCECVVLSWVYGIDRFSKDIEQMIDKEPWMWFKVLWKYVTPGLLILIILFTWIDYTPSNYGTYKFPAWADTLGWMMSMTSVMAIPIVALYKIVRTKSRNNETLWQKICRLSQPSCSWGPAISKYRKPHQDETCEPLQTDEQMRLADLQKA
ncbi:DgyrCDS13488 [Dimorphilus gyrociliatus]|uniref:Transporter n=1 Tax=Dimorphilus gyrociliatus TaxID=2664684 RepID=A0A7I8WAV3_9ANNE|nr:DgyrCDS13488 [Dimorphilus gyrociliatus]